MKKTGSGQASSPWKRGLLVAAGLLGLLGVWRWIWTVPEGEPPNARKPPATSLQVADEARASGIPPAPPEERSRISAPEATGQLMTGPQPADSAPEDLLAEIREWLGRIDRTSRQESRFHGVAAPLLRGLKAAVARVFDRVPGGVLELLETSISDPDRPEAGRGAVFVATAEFFPAARFAPLFEGMDLEP